MLALTILSQEIQAWVRGVRGVKSDELRLQIEWLLRTDHGQQLLVFVG